MPFSGQDSWQPTAFKMFLAPIETSTGPARILTDAGEAVVKALGNNQGPHALARELIAVQLANWFELPTFEYAVIELQKDESFPLGQGKTALPGPSFVTKYHSGLQWDGTELGLRAVENCHIITKLVVFDNWILNIDRFPPDPGTRKGNFGNVFLSADGAGSGKFRIIVMDHSHCLKVRKTDDLSKNISHIDYVRDERPYGVFSAFVKFLKDSELNASLSKLGTFCKSDAKGVLSNIPWEWSVPTEVQSALTSFLVERASFLVQKLPSILSIYNSEQSKLDM